MRLSVESIVLLCNCILLLHKISEISGCSVPDVSVAAKGCNTNYVDYFDETDDLDDDTISHLIIMNEMLTIVDKTLLSTFKNLEHLKIVNANVILIEKNTFSPRLRTINLSYNLLRSFNFDCFGGVTELQELNLSHNRIVSLDGFAGVKFPKLVSLDLSFNIIFALPKEIEPGETFKAAVIIYGTPLYYLESIQDYAQSEVDILEFSSKQDSNESANGTTNGTSNNSETFQQNDECYVYNCLFWPCKYWILGSIPLGIFVGNICTILRLICPRAGKRIQAAMAIAEKRSEGTIGDSVGSVKSPPRRLSPSNKPKKSGPSENPRDK